MKSIRYLFIILALCFTAFSCQEVTEPSDITVKFPITIKVVDQAGTPLGAIEGVKIFWEIIGKTGQIPITMSNGLYETSFDFNVANKNDKIKFTITAPTDLKQFPGTTDWDTTVACGAFEKTLVFKRNPTLDCNTILNCNDITLAAKPGKDSTATIGFIIGGNQNIVLTPITSGLSGIMATVAPGLGPHTPGTQVTITFKFSPNVNMSDGEETITITGKTPDGKVCFSCTFKLHTKVINETLCDCPTKIIPITFPKSDLKETEVCIGDTKLFTIPSGIINSNTEDCSYFLERESSTPPSAIVLDAGQSTLTVSKGSPVPDISVTFRPITGQPVTHTIKYKVSVVKSSDGSRRDCGALVINFSAKGIQPMCEIDFANSSLFDKISKNPIDFQQCVDQDEEKNAKILCVKNPTSCPVTITTYLNSSVFIIEDLSTVSTTLPANSSKCFTIKFLPKKSDVISTPDTIVNFSSEMQFSGCKDSAMMIKGIAQLDCKPETPGCLREWGKFNKTESLILSSDGKSILTSSASTVFGSRNFYAAGINATAKTATIGSDNAIWKLLPAPRTRSFPGQSACDIKGDYLIECNNNTGFSGGGSALLTVIDGSIIIFKMNVGGQTLCGIAWVTQIIEDATVNGIPQVCINVCYPIN